MQYQVEINGIMVCANYSEDSLNNIFLPLLTRLTQMQKEANKRILVMLAAPPGAGKSTLSEFLAHLSHQNPDFTPITPIGMDGFHRYQDYLTSHTTIRDGIEIPMVKIKGAPITFDLARLEASIKEVASGKICSWPEYNRLTHNPRENAIEVSGDIVLLEGNYLLLKDAGWDKLAGYADYTIKISAAPDTLFHRLVDRKIKSGTNLEDATAFVNYSDMVNVNTCLNNSKDAMLNLTMTNTGEYVIS